MGNENQLKTRLKNGGKPRSSDILVLAGNGGNLRPSPFVLRKLVALCRSVTAAGVKTFCGALFPSPARITAEPLGRWA